MQRLALVVTPLAGTASGAQRFSPASGAPLLIAIVRRHKSMHPTLAAAFDAEVQYAERALVNGNLAEAFTHLERAHVLGQWYVRPHLIAHLGMLRIGWRRRDVREIIGQLMRIPGGMIGSAIGRVPRGNTGGSRVSAFQPLPIQPDLKELLVLDRRSRFD